jgi:uncharacterized membrane protein YjjB (DUF3815 family)
LEAFHPQGGEGDDDEEEEERRGEGNIETEIKAIFELSKRWSSYLKREERRKKFLYSALSGAIVWVVFFALVALQDDLNFSITAVFSQLLGKWIATSTKIFLLFSLLSLIVSGLAYFAQTKTRSPFIELQATVNGLRSDRETSISAVAALSAVERMIELLPEVRKMRYAEAAIYAVISFFISALITLKEGAFGIGVSVLVSVLIWMYFRYEATIEYWRELSRFERWQERFEEEKRDFIASL